METDNNKQESNNKSGPNNPPPGYSGPDLSGFFTKETWEWIKPLISGAGAMTGSYFLWIKPIQDKIEVLTSKINEQEKQIIRLEHDLSDLENELVRVVTKKIDSNENLNSSNADYFEIKNRNQQNQNFRKRRNFDI